MTDGTGRILLVDDEPPLLKMMGMYLKRLGYEIATVDATDRAWAEIEAAPSSFAGVVIDATMSGMSMEELALRTLNADPAVFVIAASGYPVDMAAIEATAPGRVMFLHKPFPPEMLARALRRMLAAKEENI